MSRSLTELDHLLTEDERRPSSIEKQIAFQQSISTKQDFDEIDELVEEIRKAEFEGKGARQ